MNSLYEEPIIGEFSNEEGEKLTKLILKNTTRSVFSHQAKEISPETRTALFKMNNQRKEEIP